MLTDYMLIKGGLVLLGALIWGIYCGFTGRPLGMEPPDIQTAEQPDQKAIR
jgi:hypothetical protein